MRTIWRIQSQAQGTGEDKSNWELKKIEVRDRILIIFSLHKKNNSNVDVEQIFSLMNLWVKGTASD